MRIGIIAEGTTDQAVLENILKGLGYDESDLIPIRPDLSMDETDKQFYNVDTFGGWEYVKKDCIERTKLDEFFMIADNQSIIIQVDTLEINESQSLIKKPQKQNNPNYAQELKAYAQTLRQSVIDIINGWLENNYQEKLFYAICIEEMESWILTIHTQKDTLHAANPKETLKYVLKGKLSVGDKACYKAISKAFRKRKKLLFYSQFNDSLEAFLDSFS
ncbi:MAG: hypothetical protein DRR16_01730 [Candidatus Parabeggiatoa sp. nov. 3]|nr:MAG: hypothetical protein DRR00_04015 [Gammaproteobacteria bacterium]RKZ64570.1 MAG: hypothetical protein DRQ99_15285 [Gammaproteobacteria bacterium]RKZ89833.1 MAG: hypothetical protein DRR16_01730 [Gammaproteobacteria bacterium]